MEFVLAFIVVGYLGFGFMIARARYKNRPCLRCQAAPNDNDPHESSKRSPVAP